MRLARIRPWFVMRETFSWDWIWWAIAFRIPRLGLITCEQRVLRWLLSYMIFCPFAILNGGQVTVGYSMSAGFGMWSMFLIALCVYRMQLPKMCVIGSESAALTGMSQSAGSIWALI
ncbi:hypothetical protein SB85_09735 [Xanthomonas sacchari]|nr:hypothetical protein SB85_09735 [Xanthomonas sacchari]